MYQELETVGTARVLGLRLAVTTGDVKGALNKVVGKR